MIWLWRSRRDSTLAESTFLGQRDWFNCCRKDTHPECDTDMSYVSSATTDMPFQDSGNWSPSEECQTIRDWVSNRTKREELPVLTLIGKIRSKVYSTYTDGLSLRLATGSKSSSHLSMSVKSPMMGTYQETFVISFRRRIYAIP